MHSNAGRSVEVDFLRGVVLIVIALDHIPASVISHVTLHVYAYCDAAEVFVFLGGYASAAAYCAMAARGSAAHATRRFLRRAFEIYRAYLLTAAAMLLAGLGMLALRIHPASLPYTDAPDLLAAPLHTLFDIVTLRRQPYLAAVLPMYVVFALCTPAVAPFIRKHPIAALSASVALWLYAPALAHLLPSADPIGWSFNPWAWQLMFVLGMLCRQHPIPAAFQASRPGQYLSGLALATALAFAAFKLWGHGHPEPGEMKQHLAAIRVVSFISIAWLIAQLVRIGWIGALARALPHVVTVGRHGLICFVSGTGLSIAADVVLHAAEQTFLTHQQAFAAALSVDILTIAAELGIAVAAAALKAQRPVAARASNADVMLATRAGEAQRGR